MKKKFLKLSALMMVVIMVLSMTACGSSTPKDGTEATGSTSPKDETEASGSTSPKDGTEASADFKKAKIAVALYEDSTEFSKGMQNYISYLGEAMNAEITFALFSQQDEAANVTTAQQLISSGVDGIIGTTDVGTASIVKECEAAGVYYASYLCDLNTSYNNAYEDVFGSDMFLGAVSDGPCADKTTMADIYFDSLIGYNEAHPDAQLTHVSMTIFPIWAFPVQTACAQKFVELVDEYNKTAETPITVDPLDEAVDVLQFAPLDSTYFSKHADIDAIISFADGGVFVYPTMIAAGVDSKIKLFTAGFSKENTVNFGSNGTQTFQQEMGAPIEAVAYPLVLMVNKLNDAQFSDMPKEAERVDSSLLVANSDETIEKMMKSLYATGKSEDAFLTAEDVANLTAVANPDATYAGLVKTIQGLNLDMVK